MLDAGAKRFGSGFLRCEASGKTLCGTGSGAAIRYFPIGEYALQEAVAVAFNRASDARDFDQVDSRTDQHDATVAQQETFSARTMQNRIQDFTPGLRCRQCVQYC